MGSSNPYPSLQAVTAALEPLKASDGVQSIAVGIEANITAADYPLIRVVPSTYRRDDDTQYALDFIVYYGALSHAFQDGGLDAQYAYLFDMESKIKRIVIGAKVLANWQDTMLDEDRLPGYKIFASRYTMHRFR